MAECSSESLQNRPDGRDDTVQTDILRRLQQYGDSWLDDKSYKHFVQKASSKSQRGRDEKSYTIHQMSKRKDSTLSRRQRKKMKNKNRIFNFDNEIEAVNSRTDIKNTKILEVSKGTVQTNPTAKQKPKLKNKKLEKLKTELGLYTSNTSGNNLDSNDVNIDVSNSGSSVNPGLMSGERDGCAEIVVFNDPAKRKKKKQIRLTPASQLLSSPDIDPVEVSDAQPEMNLRQARFDVHTFGIKGFEGQKKETALHDMLIKLGAKPPKRKGYNYKEYMSTRKHEIIAEKEKHEMDRKLGLSVSKQDKKRRRKNGIGHVDGQIGSYRSGVQVLNRDDIQRVKKLKVKK